MHGETDLPDDQRIRRNQGGAGVSREATAVALEASQWPVDFCSTTLRSRDDVGFGGVLRIER